MPAASVARCGRGTGFAERRAGWGAASEVVGPRGVSGRGLAGVVVVTGELGKARTGTVRLGDGAL